MTTAIAALAKRAIHVAAVNFETPVVGAGMALFLVAAEDDLDLRDARAAANDGDAMRLALALASGGPVASAAPAHEGALRLRAHADTSVEGDLAERLETTLGYIALLARRRWSSQRRSHC